MIRTLFFFLRIAKENSIVLTLGIANLSFMGYLFWKLFKNHLTHINESIQANNVAIQTNGKKIDNIDKDVRKLGERVSKVEGKLEK